MKKNLSFLMLVAGLLAATLVFGMASCTQEADASLVQGTSLRAVGAVNACGGSPVGTANLPRFISADRTLYSDTVYILTQKTYVIDDAELTIQPGTTIKGQKNATPQLASALIVTRGSKIFANGEATCPIVFTSAETTPEVGDWGGVVILGNARVNQPSSPTIEGIDDPTLPEDVDITYGTSGSDAYNGESSGILRYVRVEYAGASISADNELNSFTFGGVGSGTTLEYLQAYYGADDSFEFFGGTVNGKYLISTAANDDAFDFDFGYRGKLQFLVAVLDPEAPYSANANGIESDNDATGSSLTPYTRAVISNLTIVGTEDGETSGDGTVLYGTHFRRNSRFVLRNSVIYGYNTAIYLNGSGVYNYLGANLNNTLLNDSSYFAHNVVGRIDETGALWHNAGWTPNGTNSLVAWNAITLRFPFTYYRFFNFPWEGLRPTANPALSGANYEGLDSFFDVKNYKGALSDADYWITEDWVNTDFPLTW